jgi:hypothetical protein
VQRFKRMMHATPKCICPYSLRTKVVLFLVVVSNPVWVLLVAFGQRAHAPPASLMARPGFHRLVPLP